MYVLATIYLGVFWLYQARVQTAPRRARLSIAERTPIYFLRNIDGNPGTYSYGYDISDPETGNTQFRSEERYANGTVVGSYGYVDPAGTAHNFRYVADENGYRLFKDMPNKYFENQVMVQPARKPEDQSIESSITWTRPKKNKKKPEKNIDNKTEVDKNYINREINFDKPPSYYVEH